MPTKSMNKCLVACIVVALGLPGAPAVAAPSDDLRDLVDVKGASGESELEKRGYTHIDTDKSRSTAYSYWWSNAKQSCIRVETNDGRYRALTDTDPSDCGQTKKESGMSDGAKIAIAAAALAGVAALAHKSHQRNKDRNYDAQQTADFERGYRDGLYNNSYHNYGNNRDYSDGYSQGVEERAQQSSYRGNYSNYDRSGYRPYSSFSDLNGRDTAYAWGQLERRGFQLAGERKMRGDSGQWFYWNESTRQCVDIHTRGTQVESIFEAGSYACGR